MKKPSVKVSQILNNMENGWIDESIPTSGEDVDFQVDSMDEVIIEERLLL